MASVDEHERILIACEALVTSDLFDPGESPSGLTAEVLRRALTLGLYEEALRRLADLENSGGDAALVARAIHFMRVFAAPTRRPKEWFGGSLDALLFIARPEPMPARMYGSDLIQHLKRGVRNLEQRVKDAAGEKRGFDGEPIPPETLEWRRKFVEEAIKEGERLAGESPGVGA